MSTACHYPTDVSDAQWEVLQLVLPPPKWRPGGPGRKPMDRRRVINYEKIVTAIRQIARSGHIDLCEGLGEQICTACFADPRVERVRVWVEKLDVFEDAESVGAILERSRPAGAGPG